MEMIDLSSRMSWLGAMVVLGIRVIDLVLFLSFSTRQSPARSSGRESGWMYFPHHPPKTFTSWLETFLSLDAQSSSSLDCASHSRTHALFTKTVANIALPNITSWFRRMHLLIFRYHTLSQEQ